MTEKKTRFVKGKMTEFKKMVKIAVHIVHRDKGDNNIDLNITGEPLDKDSEKLRSEMCRMVLARGFRS